MRRLCFCADGHRPQGRLRHTRINVLKRNILYIQLHVSMFVIGLYLPAKSALCDVTEGLVVALPRPPCFYLLWKVNCAWQEGKGQDILQGGCKQRAKALFVDIEDIILYIIVILFVYKYKYLSTHKRVCVYEHAVYVRVPFYSAVSRTRLSLMIQEVKQSINEP